MSDSTKMVLIGVIALVVGAAIGAGVVFKQVDELKQQAAVTMQERDTVAQSAQRLRRANDDATKKYSTDLGKFVMAAPVAPSPAPAATIPAPGETTAAAPAVDATQTIDSARALLAARDGLMGPIDRLRLQLNSDSLDTLAAELANPTPNAENVSKLMSSLRENWPAKQQSIENATREFLTSLGIVTAAPTAAPVPAAAPATSPAPAPTTSAPATAPPAK